MSLKKLGEWIAVIDMWDVTTCLHLHIENSKSVASFIFAYMFSTRNCDFAPKKRANLTKTRCNSAREKHMFVWSSHWHWKFLLTFGGDLNQSLGKKRMPNYSGSIGIISGNYKKWCWLHCPGCCDRCEGSLTNKATYLLTHVFDKLPLVVVRKVVAQKTRSSLLLQAGNTLKSACVCILYVSIYVTNNVRLNYVCACKTKTKIRDTMFIYYLNTKWQCLHTLVCIYYIYIYVCIFM